MQQTARHLPVVFVNTYQRAAKYWFYTGSPSFSMNTPHYRRNNFNMWPIEDSLIGRDVYLDVPGNNENFQRLFQPHGWSFPNDGIQHGFYSFSRVLFSGIRCSLPQEHTIQINTRVTTPANYKAYFQQPAYSETPVWLVLYEDGEVISFINSGTTVKELTGSNLELTVNMPAGLKKGKYTAR